MSNRYWINDDGPPRYLLRETDEGSFASYKNGVWVEAQSLRAKVVNGDGVDYIDEKRAMGVQAALDKQKDKAHDDRAGPPAIGDDREAVEESVTNAVGNALAKARERLFGRIGT